MSKSRTIERVEAWEVIDSEGRPTLRVRVELENGALGVATAPSGRSTTGQRGREKRDRDAARYSGDGVRKLAELVSGQLKMSLRGKDVGSQAEIDGNLRDFYGSEYPHGLGTNATCAVSMAVARAAAMHSGTSLFVQLGGGLARRLPVPLISVPASRSFPTKNVGFKDIMIVPHGAPTFSEAVRYGAETLNSLRTMVLTGTGSYGTIGGDGGVADLEDGDEACALIVEAIERAGFEPGKDVAIAIDAAAGCFFSDGRYRVHGVDASAKELGERYASLARRYPIVSIEDGFNEDGWDDFRAQTAEIGGRVQIVGDDLYATDEDRVRRGVDEKATNAVLVKIDRAGTLTAAMDAIDASRSAGWRHIISHRSRDSEDTFVSDFAVATGSSQIKAGSLTGSENVAKYNRLIEIERELGDFAVFRSPFPKKRGV